MAGWTSNETVPTAFGGRWDSTTTIGATTESGGATGLGGGEGRGCAPWEHGEGGGGGEVGGGDVSWTGGEGGKGRVAGGKGPWTGGGWGEGEVWESVPNREADNVYDVPAGELQRLKWQHLKHPVFLLHTYMY